MSYIPLMFNIKGKNIFIIGGGSVASRRANTLKDSGAVLNIVSPELNDHLNVLWKQGEINWKKKHFEAEDIYNADLVIAATNHKDVNQFVKQSVPPRALLNMTDSGSEGSLVFPGIYRQGKLVFSVSTESASPMLVSQILKELESYYDDRYENYVDFLYTCRMYIKKAALSKDKKNKLLKQLLSEEYLDRKKQKEMLASLNELI